MCTAVAIAGLALSAASTAANSMAASKVARARSDVMAAERIRQQEFDRQAEVLNTGSQDRYQGFEGQREAKAKTLGDYFAAQNLPSTDAPAIVPTSNSDITVREEARQREAQSEESDQSAAALGDLRSFGDLLGGIGRLQARDASKIGQIGGFKRGSSEATAYELEAANQKGGGLKTFADLLGGAGSIATQAGLQPTIAGLGGAGASVARAPILSLGGATGGMGAAMPQQGLTLARPFSSLPTFAQPSSLGRYFL